MVLTQRFIIDREFDHGCNDAGVRENARIDIEQGSDCGSSRR